MDITIIRYARLRNLGNFENERVELEATVAPGEDPTAAYTQLRADASALLFPPPPPKSAQKGDVDDLPF